jgi:hypothetical protein
MRPAAHMAPPSPSALSRGAGEGTYSARLTDHRQHEKNFFTPAEISRFSKQHCVDFSDKMNTALRVNATEILRCDV